MSRVLKQLEASQEAEQPKESIKEKPSLHVVPPPMDASKLGILLGSSPKKSSRMLQVSFVLAIVGGGYFFKDHPRVQNWMSGLESEVMVDTRAPQLAVPSPKLSLEQQFSDTQLSAEAEHKQAIELYQKEKFSEAQKKFEGLLLEYPNSPQLQNNLALVYFRQGEFKKSKKLFLSALSTSAPVARSFHNYAALLVEMDQLEDALVYLNRALELNPELIAARLSLGKTYELLGDPAAAIQEYEKYGTSSAADPYIRKLLQERVTKLKAIQKYFKE